MVFWQFGDNYDQAAGLKLTHTKQRGAKSFLLTSPLRYIGFTPVEDGVVFEEMNGPLLVRLLLYEAVYKDDRSALLPGPDGSSHLLSLAEGDPVVSLVIRLQEEGIDPLVFFVSGVRCRAIG
jgi:hypothetical protein